MNHRQVSIIHRHCIDIFDKIEHAISRPIVSYNGEITKGLHPPFEYALEQVKARDTDNSKVAILLRTSGGSVEGAERMVAAIRYLFSDVMFIIDKYAMSAGTMVALSGNEIMMHYNATLGPIDPQVRTKEGQTPVSGYLHKIAELTEKSVHEKLTPAELIMLRNTIDLGKISEYESVVKVAKLLVEKWLVTYKFSSWNKTMTTKKRRAKKIANALGDFKRWHIHGRPLGLNHLQDLQLKITDYTKDTKI